MSNPLFDRDEALSLCAGDEDLFKQVAAIAVDQIMKMVGEIRKNISDNDAHQTGRSLHSVRGTCSNVGANTIADESKRIETAITQDQEGGLAKMASDLEAFLESLVQLSGALKAETA